MTVSRLNLEPVERTPRYLSFAKSLRRDLSGLAGSIERLCFARIKSCAPQ